VLQVRILPGGHDHSRPGNTAGAARVAWLWGTEVWDGLPRRGRPSGAHSNREPRVCFGAGALAGAWWLILTRARWQWESRFAWPRMPSRPKPPASPTELRAPAHGQASAVQSAPSVCSPPRPTKQKRAVRRIWPDRRVHVGAVGAYWALSGAMPGSRGASRDAVERVDEPGAHDWRPGVRRTSLRDGTCVIVTSTHCGVASPRCAAAPAGMRGGLQSALSPRSWPSR